ncbi:4'-phosphopantetheinyl transferase [Streptomyces hiroshimensis]|uniref:4'-phosphopantetheinyl transferase n=2 Tax=Streptomyces hiroshimensis TaxID=66424 RepID=A0ABQ2YHI5_9ACTN|nr:4'-phosphopantetheinyl transferase [Streptomyces hiroshimensis]
METSASGVPLPWETLSAAERDLAQGMLSPSGRSEFVVVRAAVRAILGRYLGRAPSTLEFTTGAHGKPSLGGIGCIKSAESAESLEFNVSHTRGLALVAVTSGHPVGVDVEHVEHVGAACRRHDALARRFFTPRETERISRAARRSPRLATEAFLRHWTCKESCLKALGVGLSAPLDAVEVHPARNEASVGRGDGSGSMSGSAAAWHVETFHPTPEHVAAFAVPRRPVRVRAWDWCA